MDLNSFSAGMTAPGGRLGGVGASGQSGQAPLLLHGVRDEDVTWQCRDVAMLFVTRDVTRDGAMMRRGTDAGGHIASCLRAMVELKAMRVNFLSVFMIYYYQKWVLLWRRARRSCRVVVEPSHLLRGGGGGTTLLRSPPPPRAQFLLTFYYKCSSLLGISYN